MNNLAHRHNNGEKDKAGQKTEKSKNPPNFVIQKSSEFLK